MNQEPKEVKQPSEADFLYNKHVTCTICDKTFETRVIRSAKLRRLQPDFDLRPRFRDIDTLKYDVYACPYCGYAAMRRYFEHLTKGQVQLVKEQVCSKFEPGLVEPAETIDYAEAITRYKRAMTCSEVKKAKGSEVAYTCLKISWLYRSVADEMPEGTDGEKAKKAEIRKVQEVYYKKAFDGFQAAVAGENFPICGMDSYTLDYLMACLACHFKEYYFASKAISNILSSQTVDRRMKDKALDLKYEILEGIKKADS